MSSNSAPPGALADKEVPTSTNVNAAASTPYAKPAVALPDAIGRYRIVRLLGEGGMGIVYEAEQDQPRRRVAIKIFKGGLLTQDLRWRFEHETQALGRLRHPGIAQIYEAGTANSGSGPQPYFAMELVRGEPLLQYAERRRLNTRQRLEVMVKVCEAVQHAHQCGIIHRDLKPSNILVEENGQPKVLDLGVARITDSDAQATRQTDLGQLVGTLAYMSPEQVLADPLALDTRSDVYALGVILFELLAGRLPYKISRQLPEAVHTIREEDPTRLSTIDRTYRGDVETIAGKALEKDKTRRYASAADLAADIRRYLSNEPITARPPSVTYRLTKFACRNKALVFGITAVFLVLVAGIIASTWEAVRARRAEAAAIQERNRADTEAASATAVSDFLQNDLLAQASANGQAQGGTRPDLDLKVRTALDRAASRINDRFRNQPLIEAAIRQTVGDTYEHLGVYPEARRQLQRALDLRRRVLGETNSKTLDTMADLANLDEDDGDYQHAEQFFSRILELRRSRQESNDVDASTTMSDLADCYVLEGKFNLAEPLYLKALEVRRRILGEENPATADTMIGLAQLYRRQGRYADSEPLFIKVIRTWRRFRGNEHPDTLGATDGLAQVYVCERKYMQAEQLYRNVLRVRRRILGSGHPVTLQSVNHIAIACMYEGKYAEAAQLLNDAVPAWRRALGSEHPDTLGALVLLGQVRLEQGKYGDAESALDEALRGFGKKDVFNTWIRYRCQALLGASLAGQRKFANAEPLLISGYEGMLQRQSTIPAFNQIEVEQAGQRIVQFYETWGKPNKAAEWRAKLRS